LHLEEQVATMCMPQSLFALYTQQVLHRQTLDKALSIGAALDGMISEVSCHAAPRILHASHAAPVRSLEHLDATPEALVADVVPSPSRTITPGTPWHAPDNIPCALHLGSSRALPPPMRSSAGEDDGAVVLFELEPLPRGDDTTSTSNRVLESIALGQQLAAAGLSQLVVLSADCAVQDDGDARPSRKPHRGPDTTWVAGPRLRGWKSLRLLVAEGGCFASSERFPALRYWIHQVCERNETNACCCGRLGSRLAGAGRQVLQAMAHAHSHGVALGDLSCATVFISPDGRDVKLGCWASLSRSGDADDPRFAEDVRKLGFLVLECVAGTDDIPAVSDVTDVRRVFERLEYAVGGTSAVRAPADTQWKQFVRRSGASLAGGLYAAPAQTAERGPGVPARVRGVGPGKGPGARKLSTGRSLWCPQ
jgi:hypothetical protein